MAEHSICMDEMCEQMRQLHLDEGCVENRYLGWFVHWNETSPFTWEVCGS